MGPVWLSVGELTVLCHHHILFPVISLFTFPGQPNSFYQYLGEKEKTKPEFQSDKNQRKLTKDIVLRVSHMNSLRNHVSLVFSV